MSIKSPLNRQFGTQFDSVFDVVKSNPMYDKTGGKIPSLDLNFAKSKSLSDSRSTKNKITFSRASTGTYVGSDGLIKTSPVNLFTYSEQVGQWNQLYNATVTANAALAPDGSMTADRVRLPANSGTAALNSYVSTSGNHTGTIYVKAVTSGTDNTFNLYLGSPSELFTATDEWQRFTFTANTSDFRFGIVNGDDSFVTDVLLWGAQLEEGTTSSDYLPTGGSKSGAPRFDHDPVTGESLGLLIEEERTNIVLNSVDGEVQSITNMTGPTSVYGPGGTDTAFQYLSTGGTVVSRVVFKAVVAANATQYTATVYVKGVNYNTVTFGFGNNGFGGGSRRTFYLDTITTGSIGGSAAALSIEDAGNGWRRLRVTTNATTSATGIIAYLDLGNSSSQTHTTDQGFQIYGFQIEAGTFPTSIIPTSGSAVTRAADIASIEGNEFAKTNLLEYSERFDQSAWTKNGSFASSQVPNAALAPDGTQSAEEYQNAATGTNNVQQSFSASAQPYVFSVYLKAKTVSDVGKSVLIGGHFSSATHLREAVQLPSEWTRFTKAGTATAAGWVWGVDGRTSGTFAGVNVTREESSFYVWGAQLETGDELTEYTPSVESFVSRASTATYVDDATGLITTAAVDAARYENGELLLEEARANLIKYSQDFTNSFWRNVLSHSTVTSPDGGQNTYELTNSDLLFPDTENSVPANTTNTTSIFAKYAGVGNSAGIQMRVAAVGGNAPWVNFDLTNGSVGNTATSSGTSIRGDSWTLIGYGIEPFANGWYRIHITYTCSAATRSEFKPSGSPATDVESSVGSGKVLVFGAQAEVSSPVTDGALYTTSYIPTSVSAVTRASDVSVSALGVASWYNQNEGTVYSDITTQWLSGRSTNGTILQIDNGTNDTGRLFHKRKGSSGRHDFKFSGNDVFLAVPTNSYKAASGYNTSSYITCVDKTLSGEGNVITGDLNTLNRAQIGNNGNNILNGHISRLAYFPTRLPDDKLKSITT